MAEKTSLEHLASHLEGADLEGLIEECAEFKIIPQNVKKSFALLDPKLPLPRKIRYILLHACKQLEGNPRLQARWLEVLSRFGVPTTPTGSAGSQGGNYFTVKHVSVLTELLGGYPSRWYDIGLALHFPESALREIEALMHTQPGNKFIFCLSRLLNLWVERKYADVKPPTAENLQIALRSRIVGLGDIAYSLPQSLKEHGVFETKVARTAYPSECVQGNAPLLEIVRQSFDVEISEEKSTLLEVKAVSARGGTISYQWMKDGFPLNEDEKYFVGTDKPILCINSVIMASKGVYTCKVESLTESGQPHIVQSVPVSLTISYAPTTKVLVEVYSSALREIQKSWPPSSNKAYVSLALTKHVEVETDEIATIKGDIDHIKRELDKHIEYEEVFGDYKSGSLILIEGRPGSGKTTLVHKVARDWATGKFVLKGARLVLLISLKALSKRVDASMMDILKSVYHTNDAICSALLANLEEHYGDGVCLILDGLDEYVRDENYRSTIFDIIQRKYLQQSMVIVASRHVASSELRTQADMCVEVVGFLKEHILEYVDSYPFTSKYVSAEDLKMYLTEHPNILHMCYLPLHASMISFLYSKIRDELPETESGIYKYFTLFTLLRKLRRKGAKFKSLDDLTGEHKAQFKKICRLAFEMTTRSQQVFEEDELLPPDSSQSGSYDESSLGLVTIDITYGVFGEENLYSFFHLTFQEFLAAYHLSHLAEAQQMEMIGRYGKEKHMMVVWKFFCGLVSFEGHESKFEEILKLYDNDLFRCRCAFESQQPNTCKAVVSFNDQGCLSFSKQTLEPADFVMIGYVISHAANDVQELVLRSVGINNHTAFLACADAVKPCTNLQRLDLFDNQFGNGGATTLASFLVRFESLREINLARNGLECSGAIAIAESLKCCKNLESLSFEDNRIRDDGACAIRDLVAQQHDSLLSLNFAHNHIGDTGATAISEILKCCTNLRSLHAGENQLSQPGLECLVSSLSGCENLQSLNLEWTNIHDKSAKFLSESLKACAYLQFLSLNSTNLVDSSLVILSGCFSMLSCLLEVSLTLCNIGDIGAEALASGLRHSSLLQKLDVSWNIIEDEGAVALTDTLRACRNLKKFDISANDISDYGIAYLIEHLPMKVLYFYSNCVGMEAAGAIRDGLTRCDSLSLLFLCECQMTSECLVAIAEGLKCCGSLTILELQENEIDDVGIEALAKTLPFCRNLKLLNLSHNKVSDPGATALSESLKNSDIEALHLGHNKIADKGACALGSNLKDCKKIVLLSLPYNKISKEGARALTESLKQCRSLKQLNLQGNRVEATGNIKSLTKPAPSDKDAVVVSLKDNKLSRDGIKELSDSLKYRKNLEKLKLNKNGLGDDGAVVLSKGLKYCQKLRTFSLTNDTVSDDGACGLAEALKFCYELQFLHLQFNQIGVDGAKGLSNCLQYCENLRMLDLGHNRIGDDGAKGLAVGLQHCITLSALILRYNMIGDEGARSLFKSLQCCIKLGDLFLDHNQISMKGLTDSLESYPPLKTLHLAYNEVSDDGAKDIAEILKHCKDFGALDIGHNQVADVGATHIGEGLNGLTKLRFLSLEHNQIGDAGMTAIAEGLNSYLVRGILLDVNNIGDEGARSLANSLTGRNSLYNLTLSWNRIGDEGARALAEGVKNCCDNLEKLTLAHNTIGDEGAQALAEHVQYCDSLEELSVQGNRISEEGMQALAEKLENCKNLYRLNIEEPSSD